MTNNIQFGHGFSNLSDTSTLQAIELSNETTNIRHEIKNDPGKQASVKIFYALSNSNNCKITPAEAKIGLGLYGDYVQQELQQPNSHPNIRLLLDTITLDQTWLVKVS